MNIIGFANYCVIYDMETNLKHKKILLGVTGSIAAYKSPLLVRELIKAGAEVKVVMTPPAREFVTPLILSNLSMNPVVVDMFDKQMQSAGAWHIHLSHWCNAMIIAPCSASTLGKIAHGICDTTLVTLATSLPRGIPFIISPAMDTDMWLNPSTQRNVKILKGDGAIIIPPDKGELASGLSGPGRMPEVDVIRDYVINILSYNINKKADDELNKSLNPLPESVDSDKWNAELELEQMKQANSGDYPHKFLSGRKILITAGPTYEKIDDIRYIANHSSGKMGFAIARQAQKAGADVTIIAGPVSIPTPEGVERIDVTSADEMYHKTTEIFPHFDIAIMAAAVADYTPVMPQQGKIKKGVAGDSLTLELKSTKDILAALGKSKNARQMVIGFALEATNELNYGREKLKTKNCDMIVVNSANKGRSGFGGDDNTIIIIDSNGDQIDFMPMSKDMCAIEILNYAVEMAGR